MILQETFYKISANERLSTEALSTIQGIICFSLLQGVSRIWTSLTWSNLLVIVWFKTQTNFHYCPSCLKK